MAATLLKDIPEMAPRSDQSRRLSDLRSAAENIRLDLLNGKISSEEASQKLKLLARKHRTFLNRFLDLQ